MLNALAIFWYCHQSVRVFTFTYNSTLLGHAFLHQRHFAWDNYLCMYNIMRMPMLYSTEVWRWKSLTYLMNDWQIVKVFCTKLSLNVSSMKLTINSSKFCSSKFLVCPIPTSYSSKFFLFKLLHYTILTFISNKYLGGKLLMVCEK